LVGWEDWSKRVRILQDMIDTMDFELQRVCSPEWRERLLAETPEPYQLIFLAADASDSGGAAISLEENGSFELLWSKSWSPEEAIKPIIWRETMAAMEGMSEAMARKPLGHRCLFIIAEDNTTAKAALNSWYYPKDPALCGRLLSLRAEPCCDGLMAFYIDTKKQPADELTRGSIPSTDKVREARRLMEEALGQSRSLIDTLSVEKRTRWRRLEHPSGEHRARNGLGFRAKLGSWRNGQDPTHSCFFFFFCSLSFLFPFYAGEVFSFSGESGSRVG
jgi:hypothetical protein